jgi:uncharacterized membrane protein
MALDPASESPIPDTPYDVVVRPHRSLSPTGFWIIMGILATWSFAGGIVFLIVGAWPVLGFIGIDVALVWWAFKASYGDRTHERLRLAGGTLTVHRVDKRGVEEQFAFPSYWVRVQLQETDDGRGVLALSSHGRHLVIGAFLAPEQRAALAASLSAALARAQASPG